MIFCVFSSRSFVNSPVICLPPFSKPSPPSLCVSISGLSVVLHGSVRLSLCWLHAVPIAPALTSGSVSPQPCFSSQRCFDYSRFFCTSTRIVESVADFPHKKSAGVLVALVWSLLINLKVKDSLTEWSRWTREPGFLPGCVRLVSRGACSQGTAYSSPVRLIRSVPSFLHCFTGFDMSLQCSLFPAYRKKWPVCVNLVSYSRCSSVWCGLVCLP